MSVYEASGELRELIDRVEAGERVVITRNGKQVAYLVSARETSPVASAADAIARWRNLRQDHRLSLQGLKVRDLIEEGRH